MKFAGSGGAEIPQDRMFEVPTSQGPRKISWDNIEKVLSLRMRETFEIVRERLAATGALETVGNSVVITGGGAEFAMAEELAALVVEEIHLVEAEVSVALVDNNKLQT